MTWTKPAAAIFITALFTGCGAMNDGASPNASPSPAPVVVDQSARNMCAQLREATALSGNADDPAGGGYGGTANEVRAVTARTKAQTFALYSKVPELEALTKATPGEVDVKALERWCARHSP